MFRTRSTAASESGRVVFLAEMERAVPWAKLEGLIEPHYPKASSGRQPCRLATMLRIHCLQQWYGLSDPAMEEELGPESSRGGYTSHRRVSPEIATRHVRR
jgi:hypothetical protein